ncbi:NitT/TauT family transport system substrate-binding protein [Cohnella sp. OV330]|uniref:helix-turn-helix domain-containing protein n=1 Tax=Cohnella sp. OV330 TaxID=1855288 RepID=UPI0008E35BD5|nr:helix-turn-helix domain-containing protein [Cohnella sp. OV330]SFA81025.1 NitT/TauT family transport system substrate-binding protein [Cohnella sp. OV330]
MPSKRFDFLTLHEALELLDVSRSTFDRWRRKKQLPYTKIGKEIMIDKGELERWFKLHASQRLETPEVERHEGRRTGAALQPLVVNVGYQSRWAQIWTALMMKELGWFEEELAKLIPERVVQVRWHDGAHGPALVQGMIGGHIQIASMGDYPISLAFSLSRLLPDYRPVLLAFDGKTAGGQGISLVLGNNVDIRRPSRTSELRIATVAQSSAGGRLSGLLHRFGTADARVVHRDLDECMADMARGEIGGGFMGEPYASLARHYGLGKIVGVEGLGDDFLSGVVMEESWLARHPAVGIAYLKAHLRVHRWVRRNLREAAELIARVRRIPVKVAEDNLAKIRWDAAPYAKDIAALERMNPGPERAPPAFFMPNDEIRLDASFLMQAIRELRLPAPAEGPIGGDWSAEQLY